MCLTWLFCCYRKQSFPLSLVLSPDHTESHKSHNPTGFPTTWLVFSFQTTQREEPTWSLLQCLPWWELCLFPPCLLKNKCEHEDLITALTAVFLALMLFIHNISGLPRSTAGLVFCTTAQNCISLVSALPLVCCWGPASYGMAGAGTGGPRLGWKVVLACGEGGRSPWAAPAIQDFQTEPFCFFTTCGDFCQLFLRRWWSLLWLQLLLGGLVRACGLHCSAVVELQHSVVSGGH